MPDYNKIRCPICAIPWQEHRPDCPRHEYRPEEFKVYRNGDTRLDLDDDTRRVVEANERTVKR